ncbi:MAG: hypothetical protein WC503_06940, partial [Candidatus Shapirobacteria bacterium]
SPSNTIIPPFDETPTVETQNWTETVIATAIPTETATLSPAEIPIDRDLLYNFPTSYQDLLTRPEGCVMAPDPLEDLDVFNQWKRDKLVPLFGDLMTREPNVSFDVPVYGGINPMYGISLVQFSDIDSSTLISGEQAIFCFKHDGFLYPVVMWTVGNHGGHNYGTFGLILFNGNIGGLNESGVDIIRLLSERETRIAAIDILKGPSSEYLPDVINEMLDLEMTAYIERLPLDTPDIDIGPAIIQLQP